MSLLINKASDGSSILTIPGLDRAIELVTADIADWVYDSECAAVLAEPAECLETTFAVLTRGCARWLGFFEMDRQLGLVDPDDCRIGDAILVQLLREFIVRVQKAGV